MGLRVGSDGEIRLVLKVLDNGTAVIEDFAEATSKSTKKASGDAAKHGKDLADKTEDNLERGNIAWEKHGRAIGLAVAGAATAIAALIKSQINAADEMLALSERTGIAVETLSEWEHVAEQSNTTLQAITPGLRQLAVNMQEAASGNAEAAETFKRLGVAVTDGQGQLRDINDVMLDMAERFSQWQDGAGKSALATQVFGRSGTELIPTLNMGREGIAALSDEARKMGLVISTDTARKADQFNDAISLLRKSVTGMAREIIVQHAEAMSKMATKMSEAAREGRTLTGVLEALRIGFDSLFLSGGGSAIEQERRRLAELREELQKLRLQEQQLRGIRGGDFTRGLLGLPSREELQKRIADIQGEIRRVEDWIAGEEKKLAAKRAEKPRQKPAPPVAALPGGDFEQAHANILRLNQAFFDTQQREQEVAAAVLATEVAKHEKVTAMEAARRAAINANFIAVRDSVLTESEMVEKEFGRRQSALKAWITEEELSLQEQRDNKLLSEEEFEQKMIDRKALYLDTAKRLDDEYQENRTAAEADAQAKRHDIQEAYTELNLKSALFFLNAMSVLMQTKNKTMFQIGKAAAIAGALVSAHKAAADAQAALAMIPIVGPALGRAAAAAAYALGIAQVNAIRAIEFGGGAQAAPVFAANPATGLPVAPQQERPAQQEPARAPQPQRTLNLTLRGSFFDAEAVREVLIPEINSAIKDGVHIINVTTLNDW
jgi:hypothetical protein